MIVTHAIYGASRNQEYMHRLLENLQALGRTEIGSSIFVKEDEKIFLSFLFS